MYKYFRYLVKKEISELYLATAILSFASSTVLIFESLYLYQLGFKIQQIALLLIFNYLLFLILLPFGGKIAVKFGFEHSILYSVPFLILYYLFLYFTKDYFLMIPLFILTGVIFKVLYWVAYHANFSYYGTKREFGKQLGFLYAIVSLVMLAGPFLGGFILDNFGFLALFSVQAVLLLISTLPLFKTKEKFKPKQFGYWEAWKRLFEKKGIGETIGFMAFGEEVVGMFFWPIFIFVMVETYTATGLVVSLSTLAMALFSLWWANIVDGGGKIKKWYYFGGICFYAFTYFLRIFTKTPAGVLTMGVFDRIGRSAVDIPTYALIYRKAREVGSVNQAVKFEMGLSLGKVLILVMGLCVAFIFPDFNFLKILFFLSIGFTMLYWWYYKKR
jgi:MFS family permease